jgi:exodeoxyribonuclease V alpha subunit
MWRRLYGPQSHVLVVAAYHRPLRHLTSLLREEAVEVKSATVAALAQRAPGDWVWDGPEDTRPALVIVEEAGVCNTRDLAAVLDHTLELGRMPGGRRVHVVLTGDPDQLPPIGAGHPFRVLTGVAARTVAPPPQQGKRRKVEWTCPFTRLTHNYRAARCPALQRTIADVRERRPNAQVHTGPDVRWLDRCVPEDLDRQMPFDTLQKTCLPDFDPARHVVIVHRNRLRGTLNKMLHDEHMRRRRAAGQLSPAQWARLKFQRFQPGTRVMCRQTDYESLGPAESRVTNGQLGEVLSATKRSVRVRCEDGVTRAAPPRCWDLAYALTCHTAQGGEFERVYVCVQPHVFLTHRWLYTALSRAKAELVYTCSRDAHAQSVLRTPPTHQSRLAMLCVAE